MSMGLVTSLALLAFVMLVLARVPVAFALIIGGALGIILTGRGDIAFSAITAAPYNAIGKYDLLVLPMFILLGAIVAHAGIATAIFHSVNRLLGWMPGGLGVATVGACTIFGGISGSSAADVATIGRISVNEMHKHGYDLSFSAGLVAASGAVAILIPPSIPIVLYGIITGLPITALLLAGIIPGIFSAVVFAVYVVVRTKFFAPVGAGGNGVRVEPNETVRFFGWDTIGLAYAALLFTIIIGGMYTGVFTSTEAAAVGAFAAFLIALPMVRYRRVNPLKMFYNAIMEAAKLSSMIFALLIGTIVFTYFLAITRLPMELTSWITGIGLSTNTVIICFLLMLVALGMFLDGLSMLLLTVPIAFPVLNSLGVDGVWLGIMIIIAIEIGLITPPIGINVYVITGVVDGLTLGQAFRGVAPFIILKVLVLATLFAFPEIVLFLPRLAAGG